MNEQFSVMETMSYRYHTAKSAPTNKLLAIVYAISVWYLVDLGHVTFQDFRLASYPMQTV